MRFNIIKTVFAKELREMLRDRRSLMVMFGIPLVLYPLMTLALSSVAVNRQQTLKQQNAEIAVVHGDQAPHFLDLLKAPDSGIKFTLFDSAEQAKQKGAFDAVLIVRANAQTDLLKDPPPAPGPTTSPATTPSADPPGFTIQMDLSQSQGPYVRDKIEHVLDLYGNWVLQQRILAHSLPTEILTPIDFKVVDTATGEQNLGKKLATIIPLLLLMTGMLGALFPALNATTTERELGTLETLLVTPASRSELLMAKGTLVLLCGLLTAFLNMASMSAVLWRVISAAQSTLGDSSATSALDIPALALSYLAAFPAILLFTTLVLIVGLIARNFREANSFATPVMLIPMASIVVIIAEVPSTNALMLTPVLSTTLIIRDLLSGPGKATVPHFLLAFFSSFAYAGLMLSVATRLFTNEQLVNPSWEPLSLKGFGRGTRRRRLPAIDEAIAIFSLSLLLTIYLGADKLNLSTLVITEVFFVAGPALLVALLARYDFRATFSLRLPTPRGLLAGLLLGLGLIPVAIALQTVQNHYWPPDAAKSTAVDTLTTNALLASPILFPIFAGLFAGLCEEFLYRGPLQTALIKRFSPAVAITVTAIAFSLAHFDLHGAPLRALLGAILGLIVYRTGSLLPAILAHALFDSVQLLWDSWQIHQPTLPAATLPADTVTSTDYLILGLGVAATVVGLIILPRHKPASAAPPALSV